MKITLLRKKVYPLLMILGVAYAGIASVMYGGGPPSSMTNATGENNCTSCHSGSLNPTPGNLTNLTLTGSFTGGGYLPDSTYSLTLSYSQSGISRFGFQITALRTDNNDPTGDFTAGTGSAKQTATVSGKTRQYLNHTSGGTSGSGSKSWTFTWDAPPSNVDTISFYVVVNAANSDGQNTGDQIYAKIFKIAASSLLPTASISVNRNLVCAGDTLTLMGSGTNSPTSYKWKFHSGIPQIVNTQNVTRTYSTVGTFSDTLWVSNNKGESKPVRNVTQVVAKPSASIPTIVPGTTVCDGDSITLTANAGAGLRYSWNTGNPADTFQSLKVFQSGSFKVTVTNSSGCSRESNVVALTFKPLPVSGLSFNPPADTVCFGDSIVVTADTGYVNYEFYNGTTLLQSGTSNVLTLKQVGSYAIRVVSDNGSCEASSLTVNKTIKALLAAPILSCGTSTTDEVNFNWTPVAGAVGYEVSIDNGTFVSTTATTWQVTGLNFNTQVNIRVRALGTGNCSVGNLATLNCTSLACSQFTYDLVVSDSALCEGDTLSLDINNLSLTSYSITYNGGQATTDTHFEFVPTVATAMYTIEISDLNSPGCPPFVINGNFLVEQPSAVNVIYTATSVCKGLPIELVANGNGFISFSLFNNGTEIGSNTTGIFSQSGLANGAILHVVGTGIVCVNVSNSQVITIHQPVQPGFTITGSNRDWDFIDTTSNITSRVWDFGDNSATQTTASVSHTYAVNDVFDVRLYTIDNNTCEDSATQQVTTDNVGLIDALLTQVKLYPNPASDYLQVETGFVVQEAEIWNTTGQRIQIKAVNTDHFELDLSGIAPGAYFLKLKWDGHEAMLRFIIE